MSGLLAFFTTMMANPMFVAIGGGAILTGLMVSLRSIPMRIWNSFLHLFTLEVHVENDDEAFYHVDKFLSTHKGAQKARTLRLTTERKRHFEDDGNKMWHF